MILGTQHHDLSDKRPPRQTPIARFCSFFQAICKSPALDTVDAGRGSINQSGPLRVLIVEILMRLVGAICNVDLSNFEQSWPWWWTKLDNGRRWESRDVPNSRL